MPKKKTRKTASKKFRANKGGIKCAQTNTGHNTGKMRPKRKKRLSKIVMVTESNVEAVKKMVPKIPSHK